MIEVMPIAEFAGTFGWGYDGVFPFAVYKQYGRPEDLASFVDAAHELGLAVILDVVYNHIGPIGNVLPSFSPYYFSKTKKTEWGAAINFDGHDCGPVREYVSANARYWIDEFHFDGFRIDATQQIFDASRKHIIPDLSKVRVRRQRIELDRHRRERASTILLRPAALGGRLRLGWALERRFPSQRNCVADGQERCILFGL